MVMEISWEEKYQNGPSKSKQKKIIKYGSQKFAWQVKREIRIKQILNIIKQKGSITSIELREIIGYKHAINANKALRDMMREGYLKRSKKIIPGKIGNFHYKYYLRE